MKSAIEDNADPALMAIPPESEWLDRPDPATTGIRYMLTKHGKSIRKKWPVPDSSLKSIESDEVSSEGCKKQRITYIGHRQRSAMYLVVCMDHHNVVGYHVIPHCEGRRDAFLPIYRFMEHPPKALFGDYVCGIEETSMNYLPEFFLSVQWYHDVFHGCTHGCSDRFTCRMHAAFAVLNTSLMEQVK